jgi:hypothetical protein
MIASMKRHEREVRERLARDPGRDELAKLSRSTSGRSGGLQHERLVHLMSRWPFAVCPAVRGFAVLNPALALFSACRCCWSSPSPT